MSLSEIILRTIATALNITISTTQKFDENAIIAAIANTAKIKVNSQSKKPLASNKTFSINEIEALGDALLNIVKQSFENIRLITSKDEAKTKLNEFLHAWRMITKLIYALPDEYYETANTPYLEDVIARLKRQLILTNILYHAAKQNNIAFIEVVLEHIALHSHNPQKLMNAECPQPNQETNYDTPLHAAVRNHQIPATKNLLSNTLINVNSRNSYGDTALHIAISTNNLQLVKILLKHRKIDLNIKNRDGNTPLHIAAQNGHFPTLDLLIKAGAKIDCWNEDGNTPLHLAALNKHESIIKMLQTHHATESNNKAGKKPSDYYKSYSTGHLSPTNGNQEEKTSPISVQPCLTFNCF